MMKHYFDLLKSGFPILYGNKKPAYAVALDGTTEYAAVRSNIANTGNEICTNQGFESNTTGWGKLGTATITRITSDFHSGVASAECVTGTSSNYVCYTGDSTLRTNANPSPQKVLVTFWAKSISGDVTLNPYGIYGTVYRINGVMATTITLTSSWVYYEVEYFATSSNGFIALMYTTTTGTWRIDDVSIKTITITDEVASQILMNTQENSLYSAIGSWASSGSHTGVYSTTDKFSGAGSMQVASTAGGNTSNCVSLASTYFSTYTMSAGKSYMVVFKARMTLAGTNVTISIGNQSKTFTGISTVAGTFTHCIFNFAATSSEIGVPIKIWLSQADTGYIDEIGVYETYPMELEAWFKTSTAGAIQTIISKQTGTSISTSAGYLLSIRGTNNLAFQFYDLSGVNKSISGTTTVTDGKWHKVKITYEPVSGSTIMLLDNNPEASGTLDVGFTNNIQNFTIGAYSYNAANKFNGELGEICLKINNEKRLNYKWEGKTDAEFLSDKSIYLNKLTGTGVSQASDQITYKNGYR